MPTIRPIHFRATAADLHAIETIAIAMRAAGRPFSTRTDAIRVSLEAIAANPALILAAASK